MFNFLRSNHLQGKIILPANICSDVVDTLRYAGTELCFVDIDVHTLCLDWQRVLPLVKDVCAVLFVHTYGVEHEHAMAFEQVRALNPQIAIIDDCCLCVPSFDLKDTTADLVLFSTGEKKQLDLGIGGVGYIQGNWQYEDFHVSENVVLTNDTWVLDERKALKRLDEVIRHKEKLNEIYCAYLPIEIQLPGEFQHWRFNIMTPSKADVLNAIFASGLFASGHYAPLTTNCPIATNLHTYVINLFNDFYYTEQQALDTCEVINSVLRR